LIAKLFWGIGKKETGKNTPQFIQANALTQAVMVSIHHNWKESLSIVS
jgi:hypothetical protein